MVILKSGSGWKYRIPKRDNEPQMNADERRFVNRASASFIQAFRWLISSLCALCVLCGVWLNLTAKSAKNAKGGLSDG